MRFLSNYRVCLFFLGVLCSLHSSNRVLYTFNEEGLNKKAKDIKRTLLFHSRVEKILQCTSTVFILYYFSKTVSPLFNTHSTIMDDGTSVPFKDESIHNSHNNTSLFYNNVVAVPSKVVGTVWAVAADFVTVVKSGELLRSFFSMAGNYVLVSMVNFAVESSLNKICHRHTIGWYVQTHAPYQQTIALCIQQIDGYERMLLKSDANIEYDLVFGMCNLLLQDLERILAYMTFRIPTIEKKYLADAIAVKTLLFNYVLDWRLQIQNTVVIDKDVSKLKLLLSQLCSEVDRMYRIFALYEKHLQHRSLIRKLFR